MNVTNDHVGYFLIDGNIRVYVIEKACKEHLEAIEKTYGWKWYDINRSS